ncbi:MAG TPA: hypothetical protein VFF52_21145 [Isosphaeraceae bacterium]|nr:hypothetical protein [Isosphaeraceae bacterium]
MNASASAEPDPDPIRMEIPDETEQGTAQTGQPPPKELGVMLVTAGVLGVVLPGPGAPALLAGGLILWPEGFGRVDSWLRQRFPESHRKGMKHLDRFLSDLERRYPGSTRSR